MANTTISPNMQMPIPVVGVDPGPDWANNIDACLSITDSHNHTLGQGVQITPLGLNINSDLSMNNNNLTVARTVRFNPQLATPGLPADLDALYVKGEDLYYIDGSGNDIRFTQAGSVVGATGTITGLPSGTASASFAGNTFTFESATGVPANLNVGPVIIGQPLVGGFGVTISPAVAQASNYNLTLPAALPVATSFLVADPSGNMGFADFYQPFGGKYLPILQSGSNTNSVTPNSAFVSRVGTIVTVVGFVDVNSAGAGNVTLRFNLPIASNLGVSADLTGNGTSPATFAIVQIFGAPSLDQVEFFFIASGANNYGINYSYSYEII